MKTCSFCGAQIPDVSKFCIKCGKPVPQFVACSHCGAKIQYGDAYCGACGQKISGESIPNETEQLKYNTIVNQNQQIVNKAPHKRKKDNKALFTLALAVVFGTLMLIIAGAMYFTSHSERREARLAKETQQKIPAETQPKTPIVAPVTTKSGMKTDVTDNHDIVSVRPRSLTIVDGSELRNYCVVLGSFSIKKNAERFCQDLRYEGHSAQIAYNSGNDMYTVIVATYDDKASAVRACKELRKNTEYKNAWVLFSQR